MTHPALSPAHDWASIAATLAGADVSADPRIDRRKSRDFFWFSPNLNEALNASFGNLMAVLRSVDELRHGLSVAWVHDEPVVLRGGATGN